MGENITGVCVGGGARAPQHPGSYNPDEFKSADLFIWDIEVTIIDLNSI